MNPIPTYALYGERPEDIPAERMHCESIAERSRLYQWEIKPHRHEVFFQILYIGSGSAEVALEHRRIAVATPCVITLPPLAAHGFVFSRNVRGTVFTIVQSDLEDLLSVAPGLYARLGAPAIHRFDSKTDSAQIGRLFAEVAREFAGGAPWRLAAMRAGLQLAMIATLRASASAGEPVTGLSGRRMQHLRKFRALLDRHYREHRRIAFYAGELGITPTQLNRICRDVLGKSALGTVNQRLMLEAERDLVYSAIGIKEIAISLGFADESYFSRFFAKHAGRSPTQFRALTRSELARNAGLTRKQPRGAGTSARRAR
jgi:AraC family transcriptional activator of pobA